MIPEEVRVLTNEELDALVAEKVMGWSLVSKGKIATWWACNGQCGLTTMHEHRMDDEESGFTADGNDMLALIERMTSGYGKWLFVFASPPGKEHEDTGKRFSAGFARDEEEWREKEAWAATLPRAVAEASVLAVMQEERP